LDNFKKNENGESIEYTKDDILFKAASLEQMSSHPSAQSITRAGKEKFNSFPLPSSFHEKSGSGVEWYVNGEHIMVGSYNYIKSQFNTYTNYDTINSNVEYLKTIRDFQKRGKMVALVNINETNAGIITFIDKIRDGVYVGRKIGTKIDQDKSKKMVLIGVILVNIKFIIDGIRTGL
jgi:cation transport ATPase